MYAYMYANIQPTQKRVCVCACNLTEKFEKYINASGGLHICSSIIAF